MSTQTLADVSKFQGSPVQTMRQSEVDWAALRKPFPAESIGKLPRATKKDNPKGRCKECGGWHGLPAIHLDYVGHAAVTNRLNEAAPDWTYRIDPVLVDGADGLPHVLAVFGYMLIGGIARYEVGSVDSSSSYGQELKEAISDFIRRAAMRFGVGIDLWSKEDLSSVAESTGTAVANAAEPLPADRQAGTIAATTGAVPASATSFEPQSSNYPSGKAAVAGDRDSSSEATAGQPDAADVSRTDQQGLGPSSGTGGDAGHAGSDGSEGDSVGEGLIGPSGSASHEQLLDEALKLVGNKEARLRGYVNTFCKTKYNAGNFDEVTSTQLRTTIEKLRQLLETGKVE